jgi:hypothetical protein
MTLALAKSGPLQTVQKMLPEALVQPGGYRARLSSAPAEFGASWRQAL